jgi:hypothetical protein
MDIELIKSPKGYYEIWCDNQFVKTITKIVGEGEASYSKRAEVEYNNYIEAMRKVKTGATGKQVRKTSI